MSSISQRKTRRARDRRIEQTDVRRQIPIIGFVACIANDSPDPLRFLGDFRDEIKASQSL
jgi:hypothetical protein